jgi:uncharacterized protein YjbJ (UPF0337 family)
MGDGTTDDAKGRVKEAAGAITGDAADKVKDVVNSKDD